jgi:hypothetical protein
MARPQCDTPLVFITSVGWMDKPTTRNIQKTITTTTKPQACKPKCGVELKHFHKGFNRWKLFLLRNLFQCLIQLLAGGDMLVIRWLHFGFRCFKLWYESTVRNTIFMWIVGGEPQLQTGTNHYLMESCLALLVGLTHSLGGRGLYLACSIVL